MTEQRVLAALVAALLALLAVWAMCDWVAWR